mmetsp:Transcript_31289/g.90986  ORF Transcript_31289/g.90986 Transcript_31289/m.90986 type:complete len:317 (-) Transcript_31289:3590-4540(-)
MSTSRRLCCSKASIAGAAASPTVDFVSASREAAADSGRDDAKIGTKRFEDPAPPPAARRGGSKSDHGSRPPDVERRDLEVRDEDAMGAGVDASPLNWGVPLLLGSDAADGDRAPDLVTAADAGASGPKSNSFSSSSSNPVEPRPWAEMRPSERGVSSSSVSSPSSGASCLSSLSSSSPSSSSPAPSLSSSLSSSEAMAASSLPWSNPRPRWSQEGRASRNSPPMSSLPVRGSSLDETSAADDAILAISACRSLEPHSVSTRTSKIGSQSSDAHSPACKAMTTLSRVRKASSSSARVSVLPEMWGSSRGGRLLSEDE